MSKTLDVSGKIQPIEITVPFSFKHKIEVVIPLLSHEYTLVVEDFPAFLKIASTPNIVAAGANIKLNLQSQRLLVDTDPLLIADMDEQTLETLDISQDVTYYSIN